MRHHIAQRDAIQPRMVLLQHRELALIEAKSRHAGIDVQYRGQALRPTARATLGPGIDLGQRAEHGNDIVPAR